MRSFNGNKGGGGWGYVCEIRLWEVLGEEVLVEVEGFSREDGFYFFVFVFSEEVGRVELFLSEL